MIGGRCIIFVDMEKVRGPPRVVAADAPLVFLSRVERIKGAHTAIAACRLAGRRLIIAGNHADDDSENGRYWCNEIVPHLGQDGIEYVGPVDDVQKNELLGNAAALTRSYRVGRAFWNCIRGGAGMRHSSDFLPPRSVAGDRP